jgi:hypothetical protein
MASSRDSCHNREEDEAGFSVGNTILAIHPPLVLVSAVALWVVTPDDYHKLKGAHDSCDGECGMAVDD